MGRSAIHTTEQFKASPGSVLLAAGAAWEGFDFPGDCVSLLIIPRLPFAVPDALKEKEEENHPTLRLFIRACGLPLQPLDTGTGRTPLEGDTQSSPAGEGSADACTSDVYGKESTDRAEGLQAGGSQRDEVGLHIL